MKQIINLHRIDATNVGDCYSSPARYFSFPNSVVAHGEILDFSPAELVRKHVIVGGGGLLDEWFRPAFSKLAQSPRASLIAWGVGQQIDEGPWYKLHRQFDYRSYLAPFDLVGVRDNGYGHTWVPCASCMHAAFDEPREVRHEFVVFSHKTHLIPIVDFPHMTNDAGTLETVLDFLGSAETILTSSYHGAYWGILLNRKVVAFPFNSKFLTFRHPPTLYPALWRPGMSLFRATGNASLRLKMVAGWRILAGAARSYPDALVESRDANRRFHARVVDFISQG